MTSDHEKMELHHEAVEGYPAALKIAVIIASVYLGGIFIYSLIWGASP